MLAFQNPGSYTVTYLSLDGKEILANPGTPPISTYSVAVNLQAGQTYTLTLSGGGPSANLSWATPSDLAPGIQQAVNAAKSAVDGGGRRLRRHRVRGRRPRRASTSPPRRTS